MRLRAAVALSVAASALGFVAAASADFLDTPARTWGTNGRITAILPVGDRIYVGGTFSALIDPSGVSYSVKNLAVFNAVTGAADLSFQASTNGAVTALATDGARLYIGGAFGTVTNGATTVTRHRLAALDPSTGAVQAWAPDVTGTQVDAVTYSPATGAVYVGGNISAVTGTGGSSAPHPFIAKVDTAGAIDPAFDAAPNDRVRALNVAGDGSSRLYVGGDFTAVSGKARTKVFTAVNLTTGVVDPAFAPGPNNQSSYSPVYDVTSDATRVYVAAGGGGGACAALTAATGALVWSDHSNGNMQAVRVVAGALYCGGHYSGTGSFAGKTRQKLAAVDPATGSVLPFNPRINSALGTWTLGGQPGDPNLYVGGDFTAVSSVSQPHYAQFIDSSVRRVPQPPGALSGGVGDNVVHLSWTVPSSDGGVEVTRYKVYRAGSAGGQVFTSPLSSVPSSARTFDDTTAVNGSTYFYVVTAVNALGESVVSNEATATPTNGTDPTPPGAPASVVATNPPGSVHLTWNPPPDNGGAAVTTYNVRRGTAAGSEEPTPYATGVTATSYDDVFNVVAGTTYYYVVTAVNAAGEGAPSAEVSATLTPGAPAKPTISGAAAGGEVNLSWAPPADGGSPIEKYVLLRDAVKLAANLPASQTTFTDATVTAGQTYVYQVKAVNAQGAGPLSNKLSITVP